MSTPTPPTPASQKAGANEGARSSMMFIGCKLPHGLVLELFTLVEKPVVGMGGVTIEKIAQPLSKAGRYLLNGWSHPQNRAPHCEIIDGFAITKTVPLEFWEKWAEANQELDAMQNGLIIAARDEASLRAQIVDHRRLRSGLERIDPERLPVKGVKVADEMKDEIEQRIRTNERQAA